ncbi:probable protein NAP1 isoform X2 [Zingiber officinale]|uniref:probable protein NAP1 isoform X2 n=1 Tax=Zingiber officinale TaxID=94328 RepID=UPI001C4B44D9|nr:probable protein NAP1 isoform X2 [Zingiber officinale]
MYRVVLKEHLVQTLFRDEYDLLHEDYQLYLLPSILESKKLAKSGQAKQKYADLEYNVTKQVEKMIRVCEAKSMSEEKEKKIGLRRSLLV